MVIRKFTTSSVFLAPLVTIEKSLIGHRFINSYLKDESVDTHQDNHLFIVYSNYQDTGFETFENKLLSNKYCVEQYDIVSTYFGVAIFQIPEYFLREYQLFLRGRYSEFSPEAKGLCLTNNLISSGNTAFLSKINKDSEKTLLQCIFDKDEALRTIQSNRLGTEIPKGQELWSTPDLTNEILNTAAKEEALLQFGKTITPAKDFL